MACQAIVSYGTKTVYESTYIVTENTVIAEGDTIVLKNGMTISDGGVTWNNGIPTPNRTFINNGVIICESNLEINAGYFTNSESGQIIINGYDFTFYSNNNSYAKFYNHGFMNLTDCKFTIYHKSPGKFVNEINGIIRIDNSASTEDKTVDIGLKDKGVNVNNTANDPTTVYFAEGSLLHIKNADLNIVACYNDQNIDGTILIEDGNFKIGTSGGGGLITNISASKGSIYLLDTDDSGDDGILTVPGNGGGASFNIEGTMYAEGLDTELNGGGNTITIKDGGFAFIGNLGADLDDQFDFTVESGGTLNYCGNVKKDFADDVGDIMVNGTLNYAQYFYDGEYDNPEDEGDFNVADGGYMNPLYEDSASCVAAYKEEADILNENPLPIELVYFKGEIVEDAISLIWETASEKNNEGFKIEESIDGINWKEIGFEYGAGNSSNNINYEYNLYELPNIDLVYYRLKQVDFDGSYVYSPIVSVNTNTTVEYVYFDLHGKKVDSNNLSTGLYATQTWVNGKIIETGKIFIK